MDKDSSLTSRPHLFNPNLQRIEVAKILRNPDFKTEGVTGVIEFEPSGDRQNGLIKLVKVIVDKDSTYGYRFVPLN
jgi:ABC-type branched-subunit amino acid transport system substrate-binding protein